VLFHLQRFIAVITMICCALFPNHAVLAFEPPQSEQELVIYKFLHQLFEARSQFLLSKDEYSLTPYYLPSEKLSMYSLKQEQIRKQYLNAWASHRKLQFNRIDSQIRIQRMKIDGDRARIALSQSMKLEYAYTDNVLFNQAFGVGTRHALLLINKNGQWYVQKEWYSDPLNENPELIPKADKSFPNPLIHNQAEDSNTNKAITSYHRERAVAYANKYAGAAWGAGNSNRYNNKYRDYTSLGGDCTNFASQVIGDPIEGGGLKMTDSWRYWLKAGGSHTWVQTDRFSEFLQRSGYGRIVAQGTFEDITRPSEKYPYGAIGRIKPGDLIAYMLHDDDVDHFGILVGFDESGYPLVNSHTADRNKVPFDLGWDQNTRYQLIHIRD